MRSLKKIKRTKLTFKNKKINVYGNSSYQLIIPRDIVNLLELRDGDKKATVEYLEGTNYFTVIIQDEED